MHGDVPAARSQRQRDLAAEPFGSASDQNNFCDRGGGVGRHRAG